MRIAVLEDNPSDATLLESWLDAAGHQYQLFGTAGELLKALGGSKFDLLLLDWQLPDMDGDTVLRRVRDTHGWELPVIFVTARDDSSDVVAMLEAGADDYVTKPVDFEELLARIVALGRRTGRPAAVSETLEIAGLRVEISGRRISLDGANVELTPKEFALAQALLVNVGTLLNRDELLREIWGYGAEINTRTIEVHISRLRKKLELVPMRGWRLTSVHQVGYRLDRMEQINNPR